MGGTDIVGLVGVYRADGGPVGEAKYVLGKLLRTAHCALCDITHSPVRRRPQWDRMVERLGVPFTLLHLNEMPPDVARAVSAAPAPAILVRLADGSLHVLLDAHALEALAGSVERAEDAIRGAAAAAGWRLPDAWATAGVAVVHDARPGPLIDLRELPAVAIDVLQTGYGPSGGPGSRMPPATSSSDSRSSSSGSAASSPTVGSSFMSATSGPPPYGDHRPNTR